MIYIALTNAHEGACSYQLKQERAVDRRINNTTDDWKKNDD